MDFLSLFWLFVMISSLQPIIRQRLIEAARQRLIAQIEEKRNCRVILIVHRQETMRLLGFPLIKYLTMEDSEEVLRALEATDDDKDIDLVLHTPGGLVIAALQIARAIQRRKGKTRVIVPHYAMSGGTLIALAADEIIMSKNAVLGPIDPQLGEFPAPSLVRLRHIKDVNEIDDRTLILADIAEKAISQIRQAVTELLLKNYSAEQAERIAEELTVGQWTHDFPITPSMAQELGLRVRTDIPVEYLQLMSLYPQPLRMQRSVEFLGAKIYH
ncbi:MAG: ATP-dependent Clp protease proteolytic subunit [Bacteroidota bacterium]|nr:ATP-dependent Clp protease proteolytic subunit [Candidatus Kapabacteria bacterium]MDW8074333.1 ATP-dependent Clp protease proteolytic subunit [Bacteroidota bacterium]MDW8271191.1 ATP-dependent Clp protease proteolytic subunit [Bacteroidota bacterium]